MTRELEEDIEHELKWMNSPCRTTREEARTNLFKIINDLEKENAGLRKVAEFQQSSNMSRHFENKKLKEGLAVGSTWNKHLNSLNKELEEERDKYRNMVFDKDEQLTKAEEIIRSLYFIIQGRIDYKGNIPLEDEMYRANQFLKEIEK